MEFRKKVCVSVCAILFEVKLCGSMQAAYVMLEISLNYCASEADYVYVQLVWKIKFEFCPIAMANDIVVVWGMQDKHVAWNGLWLITTSNLHRMDSVEVVHRMVSIRIDLGWPMNYCYRFDVESMPLVAEQLKSESQSKY